MFGEAGKIEFIERAYDGAVPLMIQLTYVPMLVLGTETSLNLWAMLSSWMTGLALYFVSREYLNSYSLVVTLLFLSMPAVIFGSGNGQIEVKLAGFVLISCWAVAKGVQAKNLSFLLLGGYLAGFYMGSKYFGLIFVLSVAVVVLLNCRVKWTALFLAACALAGFQWYLWNGIHTGDPIFPMFFAFWAGRTSIGGTKNSMRS